MSILKNSSSLETLFLSSVSNKPCGAQKHLGQPKRQCSPSLHLEKVENVGQSDSSILFTGAPDGTPTLVGHDPTSLPYSPPSGSYLLQPILMMKTSQDRLGPHLIVRGNLMALFLQWHRQTISRLWKPWSQARMGPCLTVMGFPLF